jgi:ABC-type lipoprotein export system ATPase subunit
MSGTILIATHDHNVSEIADVVINMEDGRIISIRDKDI